MLQHVSNLSLPICHYDPSKRGNISLIEVDRKLLELKSHIRV